MEKNWLNSLDEIQEFKQIEKYIKNKNGILDVYGLVDSEMPYFAAGLNKNLDRQVLIITYSESRAQLLFDYFKNFSGNDVYHFVSKGFTFFDYDATSHQQLEKRLNSMIGLTEKNNCIVVASLEAVLQKMMPKKEFIKNVVRLNYGQELEKTYLLEKIDELGYERVNQVEAKGQYSSRGGIVDIFPINHKMPYRIEFFDIEIDSIRSFNYLTQRSEENHKDLTIFPCREILLNAETIDFAKNQLTKDVDIQISKNKNVAYNDKLNEKKRYVLDSLDNRMNIDALEKYINYLYPKQESLIDYLSKNGMVFFDDESRVKGRYNQVEKEFHEDYKMGLEKGEVFLRQAQSLWLYDEILQQSKERQVIIFNVLEKQSNVLFPDALVKVETRIPMLFHGNMKSFLEEVNRYKSLNYKIILILSNQEKINMIKELLRDDGTETIALEDMLKLGKVVKGQIGIMRGQLNRGMEYVQSRLVFITEKEIFDTTQKIKRKKSKKEKSIKVFSDLKIGDYVVHEKHGIGKYIGIEQVIVQNIHKDYMKIQYQGDDFLYIPIEQMDFVQKYIGGQEDKIKVNKLGSAEWTKSKTKAKGAIKKMAYDLIALNAERKALKGFAFSEDTVWQKQFEDSFQYEETEDQLRCIEEIKRDMEKELPMDRLLCGDVGYGKTEVAIRAAFKCALEGKQTAILVPTTILAQQHYNTIIERLDKFPVNVDMVSRFRSAKQQKDILKKVDNGQVDILIGTHRILSKDIKFKDLGLLIIDEEQRFGVEHKEKLKFLKKNVDILNLSATPIPRTLHMSLIGLRDMSIIEEPPEERFPVQTYVLEYEADHIKETIYRELERGGQVYFLYNRVKGIQQMAAEIHEMVPEARIAIAHGQMNEKTLETIMMDFMKKEYDILLCTTIIESGLDIPNANTIIVYEADTFGLSQLYQLKGRVGRSNRVAYAYFTYRKNKNLTEVSEKRLKAIKEFTEFGSGFKIAMRDLEIRGAGNLLGAEQHGNIGTIGYEMYCKLLEDSVAELQGHTTITKNETSIEINVDAYIPGRYVADEILKIDIYKKIAGVQSIEDMDEIKDELEDRFGDLPEAVKNLITIAYIKSLAEKIGIRKISEKSNWIKIEFYENNKLSLNVMSQIIKQYGVRVLINAGVKPNIKYYYYNEANKDNEIRLLLEKISGI